MKFFDIYQQDKPIEKQIFSRIKKVIKKSNYILGDYVNKFENSFAKYCGVKYAISCNSGTDALFIALKSLNLPKNSEIIVPAMTFYSTISSIISAGLKPKLVDIDANSATISIDEVIKKINKKTKAIILVHLYGNSCKFSELKKKLKKNIFIIEDASQAHGAYDCSGCENLRPNCCKAGKKVGSQGDLGCFSLYPGKNLGAYGDAGIITTNNFSKCNFIQKFRNLGSKKKYNHDILGINSRLDTIQACILLTKMKRLDKLNKKRLKIANEYSLKIQNQKIKKIQYSKGSVFHQYVITCNKSLELRKFLKKKKIPFGRHYPLPVHKLKSFKEIFKNQKYPNAEELSKNGVSLPIDPLLSKKNLKKIINSINNF
jgi:dTDP-4-amino-4,6-dideoxygalactose transaminase